MNSILRSNIFYIIIFFSSVLSGTLIINKYYEKKEFSEEIHFIVDKIEETPALRCYYYDKNGDKLILNSYVFYAPSAIKRGDIITKKGNSHQLIVYRYDDSGEKKVYQTINME